MLNVAVIGFGFMGRTHFEAFKANGKARVVSVVTKEPAHRSPTWGGGNMKVGQGEQDLSGVTFYEDAADVFKDPSVHLVDVCTPTHTHAELSIAALNAGKHVLCEKPMARHLADAEKMAAAAERAGKILHIGQVTRYIGQYTELKRLANSKELGRMLYARLERHGGIPGWASEGWLTDPARSGGAVLDLHVHDVDVAQWTFGQPDQITAAGRLTQTGLAMGIDAQWSYPGGSQLHIHGRWDTQPGAPFRWAYQVEFEKGSVYCDLNSGAKVQLIQGKETRDLAVDASSPFQLQIDDVVDAVLTGRKETRVPPRSALETLRLSLQHLQTVSGRA